MQWGSESVAAAASKAVVFPIAFPTACDSVVIITSDLDASANGIYVDAISASGFTAQFNGAITGTLYWIAYGR